MKHRFLFLVFFFWFKLIYSQVNDSISNYKEHFSVELSNSAIFGLVNKKQVFYCEEIGVNYKINLKDRVELIVGSHFLLRAFSVGEIPNLRVEYKRIYIGIPMELSHRFLKKNRINMFFQLFPQYYLYYFNTRYNPSGTIYIDGSPAPPKESFNGFTFDNNYGKLIYHFKLGVSYNLSKSIKHIFSLGGFFDTYSEFKNGKLDWAIKRYNNITPSGNSCYEIGLTTRYYF